MKRFLCILVCLTLALLCVACGEEKPSEDSSATEEPTVEEIPHPVSAAWFDDAVFVGDSITLKLQYYCEDHVEALADAEFFCGGSLGYHNSLWDIDDPNAVHPYYRGDIALTEDCVQLTHSSKLFILLGMNDIGYYGVEDSGEACRQLVERVRAKSPDVTIYLQSVTPILKSCEYGDLTNANVDRFNEWLKGFCQENGCKYLDVNSVVRDENGSLREAYCSDPETMGIHFTDEACALWVDYLKNHV